MFAMLIYFETFTVQVLGMFTRSYFLYLKRYHLLYLQSLSLLRTKVVSYSLPFRIVLCSGAVCGALPPNGYSAERYADLLLRGR